MNFDHPLQRKHLLTLENDWYRNVCQSFWQQQLLWDGTDMTTELLANNEESIAILTAKSEGIVAGIQEAHFFVEQESLHAEWNKKDGDVVFPGEKIVRLSGSAQTILRIERTLLNFLSRLSGIATKTYEIRQSIPQEILLCATRKTLWGALDKRAVAVGGGGTHRLGLFDAIMIKDNHLALVSGDMKQVVTHINEYPFSEKKPAFWEIEVDTEEQFQELLNNLPQSRPGGILFDNFSPTHLQTLLAKTQKPEGIFYEASGGITPENIQEYANSGVDAISSGMLTNAAHALDISLALL